MNADGTRSRQVTEGEEPTWSADGRKIAFTRWILDAPFIFVANANGTGRRKLAGGYEPAWSPNGRTIAFLRFTEFRRGGELQDDVYLIAPNGNGLRRLTRTPGSEERPAWSPDGGTIAFVSRLDFDIGLYVLSADGSGRLRLTRGFHVNSPTWSPDGQRIAFGRVKDIYVVNADGSSVRRLARDGHSPTWVVG